MSASRVGKLNNESLYQIGLKKGLGEFLSLAPGFGRPVTKSMTATLVEALIGAVFLDSSSNLESVENTMNALGIEES